MAEQKQTNSNSVPVMRMQRSPRPGQASGMDAMTPKDIAAILRRHILLIVVMTVLGILIGGGSWFLCWKYIPGYTAETFIKVLAPVEKDPTTIGGALLQKDIMYQQRVSMATRIESENTLANLLTKDAVQETQWYKRFGSSIDKRNLKGLKKLKKKLNASAMRDADFVRISMKCRRPKDAKIIVDEMVKLFIADRKTSEEGDVNERLISLNTQMGGVKTEIKQIDDNIQRIRTDYNIEGLEEYNYRATIELKLDNLQIKKNDLELEIQEFVKIVDNLREQTEGAVGDQVQVEHQIENDSTMIVLTQRLAILKSELDGRLSKFGENHREVRQARDLINTIKQQRQERKQEIGRQTRLANLANAEDELLVRYRRMEELDKLYIQAVAEKKNLDIARANYQRQMLLKDDAQARLEEVTEAISKLQIIKGDKGIAKVVKVFDQAPLPREISFPQAKMFFPGGMVLGLMLGIGLAFLIELLNDLVRTPRDVVRYLHIPLLGVIPDESQDDEAEGADLCQIVHSTPYCIISDSYRRFKINLSLSGDESSKVLFVTSGMAGDGKTSVAINLALSFAAENNKVLLIDANFWRPVLHKAFPRSGSGPESDETILSDMGLSTLLAGRIEAGQLIRPSGTESLDIVNSGPMPPNTAELLGGSAMHRFIDYCRDRYDYVIIDGPPVLLVSEAKILAKQSDGTVLVFNAQATKRGAAQRTIRELREINAKIAGCVLFSVKALKGGYFQEQFRYYQEYQKIQLA
ncbi:MAG: exopolysaccharide transport family protein [Planctomycetota bacterium]